MEDRYLFKAKRIDNGEWVQGYLFGIWEKRYILWGMTNDIPNILSDLLAEVLRVRKRLKKIQSVNVPA